jgi:hypothetical protein
MNNDTALWQLVHFSVHFFITVIAYHTWFNFTKSTSTSASGTGHRSTIVRHRASGSRSTSHKYKSQKSWRSRYGRRTALVTENPDLNSRRNLPKSLLSKNFWLGLHAPSNAYNNRTVSFDKRIWILISQTSFVGASHKRVM